MADQVGDQSAAAIVRIEIASIAPPDVAGDTIRAVFAEIPGLGVVAEWYDQGQTREAMRRIREVLHQLNNQLEKLAAAGRVLTCDEGFAELVGNVLPLVARTRSEEKRLRFANLLSQASLNAGETSRDLARTMALIVDQMEEIHVRLLDRAIAGFVQWIGSGDVEPLTMRSHIVLSQSEKRDAATALLRMQALGLLQFGRNSGSAPDGGVDHQVEITALGLSVSKYITPDAAWAAVPKSGAPAA